MKLTRSFYLQDTLTVAKNLLGKYLVRVTPDGICSGMIVETEAYGDRSDKASHVFGNKITERTKIWFEMGGHAYVYTIYGIHYCLGIISEDKFKPGAVLIRALEPIEGLDLMYKRRQVDPNANNAIFQLCSGPSKACQSLAIDKSLYGENLCNDTLFIENRGITVDDEAIDTSPRIGVDYAGEAAHYKWRFFMSNSPFISVKKYKGPKTVNQSNHPLFQQIAKEDES